MTSNGAPAIIGSAPAVRRAAALAEKFAPTVLPILLAGATGTGKDLLARAIHHWSGRRGPFIDVNCGALPRDLVDGLLFGHRRGAFSGAVETVTGLVEAADGGTLFLDELCSLPLESQVKLLRVLETGEIRRLGETTNRRVAVRVIAAVGEGVGAMVRSGAFRLDLYQRLAGLVLELPRLMERGDDVILLARYFAAGQGRSLTPEAAKALTEHPWPGNVRELRAAIDRAAFLTSSTALDRAALAEAIRCGQAGAEGGRDGVHAYSAVVLERERIVRALAEACGNATRAAAHLGIGRTTLYRRCKAFGLSPKLARCSKRSGTAEQIPEQLKQLPHRPYQLTAS